MFLVVSSRVFLRLDLSWFFPTAQWWFLPYLPSRLSSRTLSVDVSTWYSELKSAARSICNCACTALVSHCVVEMFKHLMGPVPPHCFPPSQIVCSLFDYFPQINLLVICNQTLISMEFILSLIHISEPTRLS